MQGCSIHGKSFFRFCRLKLFYISVLTLFTMGLASEAATVRSTNFLVTGPDQSVAMQVAKAAEDFRHKISVAWLGKPLPSWSQPCPVRLRITGGEAGGVTSFSFDQGRVTSQEMTLEGSPERILFSALPHEITHTIFAWHFGCPMPRWADEGACMLSEDIRELARQDDIINKLVSRQAHLPLANLFVMEEYPNDLLGFYGQGYSVSRFLIEIGGRERFLKFVGDGARDGWDNSTRRHYNLPGTNELDRAWRSWHKVVASQREPGQLHEQATLVAQPSKPNRIENRNQSDVIRAQSNDEPIRR